MNNRIKMTDSKFKCNIFLFLSVTVFMARLSILNFLQVRAWREWRSVIKVYLVLSSLSDIDFPLCNHHNHHHRLSGCNIYMYLQQKVYTDVYIRCLILFVQALLNLVLDSIE
jgi:hypothetical protein